MIESSEHTQALPATVAASAQVYLSPAALGPLTVLAPMVTAGMALPLAGGPLAFSACEIAIRESVRVTRRTVSLAETRIWAAGQGGAVGAHVDRLLDALSRQRQGPRGGPLSRPLLMGV